MASDPCTCGYGALEGVWHSDTCSRYVPLRVARLTAYVPISTAELEDAMPSPRPALRERLRYHLVRLIQHARYRLARFIAGDTWPNHEDCR